MKQQPSFLVRLKDQNPGFPASSRNCKQIATFQTSIWVSPPALSSTESQGHLSTHFLGSPRTITLGLAPSSPSVAGSLLCRWHLQLSLLLIVLLAGALLALPLCLPRKGGLSLPPCGWVGGASARLHARRLSRYWACQWKGVRMSLSLPDPALLFWVRSRHAHALPFHLLSGTFSFLSNFLIPRKSFKNSHSYTEDKRLGRHYIQQPCVDWVWILIWTEYRRRPSRRVGESQLGLCIQMVISNYSWFFSGAIMMQWSW